MNQIFEDTPRGREGYSFGEFEERFLSICEEHRRNERAFAFAFILFDLPHPQVRKVLEDDAYWDALDADAGSYLTVFSFNVPERRRRRESGQLEVRHMVALTEPFGPREGIEAVRSFFGFSEDIELPALLFFQVSGKEIIDSLWVNLHEKRTEPAFEEIRGLVGSAVSAVQEMPNDNREDAQEVFDQIQGAVKGEATRRKIRRMAEPAKPIINFVSAIGSFFL